MVSNALECFKNTLVLIFTQKKKNRIVEKDLEKEKDNC